MCPREHPRVLAGKPDERDVERRYSIVLILAIAFQRLETVSGRYPQIIQSSGIVEHA